MGENAVTSSGSLLAQRAGSKVPPCLEARYEGLLGTSGVTVLSQVAPPTAAGCDRGEDRKTVLNVRDTLLLLARIGCHAT
jgi:hypothetical protein